MPYNCKSDGRNSHPDTGLKHIVNLEQKMCECTNFQEYESPCAHAIAACRHASIDPFKKFRKYYRLKVYRETYSRFLQPISTQDLDSESAIYPPIIKKQRGRPIVKRMRKGDWKRKQKKCSTCKEHGHDKRTCRKQLVANGRRQRARDREDCFISSPDSTDSSVINGEINEQVDVEIALYDQRFQRGQLAFQRMQAICERSPTPPHGFMSQPGELLQATVSYLRCQAVDFQDWMMIGGRRIKLLVVVMAAVMMAAAMAAAMAVAMAAAAIVVEVMQ